MDYQLKCCLVQISEPSVEQDAQVRSKNTSPTSVLGFPFFRQSEKKSEFSYYSSYVKNKMLQCDWFLTTLIYG